MNLTSAAKKVLSDNDKWKLLSFYRSSWMTFGWWIAHKMGACNQTGRLHGDGNKGLEWHSIGSSSKTWLISLKPLKPELNAVILHSAQLNVATFVIIEKVFIKLTYNVRSTSVRSYLSDCSWHSEVIDPDLGSCQFYRIRWWKNPLSEDEDECHLNPWNQHCKTYKTYRRGLVPLSTRQQICIDSGQLHIQKMRL